MINDLLDTIASNGERGSIVPYSHIADLKKEMAELKNGDFHTHWLDRMANHIIGDADKFIPPDLNFEPRSIITVIMPSPKVILQFNYHGTIIPCIVPPHYTNWESKNKQVLQYIDDYLSTLGYSVVMAITLPQKLLAVHCGLALYGRNNICYNAEFGSYMQIMNYLSDLPCDETVWFPIKRMDICEKCRACVNACPTGAIDPNRQLVNADRCITLFNENPGEFPDWIDKDAHNSITGCTKCQDCCPGNAHNKNNIVTGVTFTEEETKELINHKGNSSYSNLLAEKIEMTGMHPEFTNNLPRNLTILLQKSFAL